MCRSVELKSSLAFILLFLHLNSPQKCLNELQNRKYFKVKKCYRSDSPVLAQNNFKTLKECFNYAREKNGLAINYSPPDAVITKNNDGDYFYNCKVLGCPEITNLTLKNDTAYDYYSAFANFTVLTNATCLKNLGMFKLVYEKENYTTAIDRCQQIGADLANALTEQRTNSFSQLIANSISDFYKAAYIGLDDIDDEGLYRTPLGDPINCYKFRAWSPGHPRNKIKSDDCAVVDSDRSWKIVNCKSLLPFLCEYFPTSMLRNGTKYEFIDCDDLDDPDERKVCKDVKRNKKTKKKRKNRCLEDD